MSYVVLKSLAISAALVSSTFAAHRLPACKTTEKYNKNGFRSSIAYGVGNSLIQVKKRVHTQSAEDSRGCEPLCHEKAEGWATPEPQPKPEAGNAQPVPKPAAPFAGHCANIGPLKPAAEQKCSGYYAPTSCRADAHCRWGYCTLNPGATAFSRHDCEARGKSPASCNSAGNGRDCLWCDTEIPGGCTEVPTPPPTARPTPLLMNWLWQGCVDVGDYCYHMRTRERCDVYMSLGGDFWERESKKCCACGGGASSSEAETEAEPKW